MLTPTPSKSLVNIPTINIDTIYTADTLFGVPPYSQQKAEKQAFIARALGQLCAYHYGHSAAYRQVIDAGFPQFRDRLLAEDFEGIDTEDIPFLPVRLFKTHTLKSVADTDVIKTLISSGTTGQQVSKIYLDKPTSYHQTKALSVIIQDFLGRKRLPMLIADTIAVIKDRALFSARGAGILGLSTFGTDHHYLLKTDMTLDKDALVAFLDKYNGQPIFIFGFTFMVWQYLYQQAAALGLKPDLSQAILIHSGGWKKLQDQAVSNTAFKARLADQFGLTQVYNFYGMVEQVGSIFMECSAGHFHTPYFADVIIRNYIDWKPVAIGQTGIIQVLSLLPQSYPGHSLLTEDEGTYLGEDNCPCGRHGKYFNIIGRIAKAELRGCSDTHAPVVTD